MTKKNRNGDKLEQKRRGWAACVKAHNLTIEERKTELFRAMTAIDVDGIEFLTELFDRGLISQARRKRP